MSEFKFPTDTCVLACSGPSLNLVDPFSLGLPVVVVSTAIRVIPNPHFWILADYLNEMHGEPGNNAYQNENILKIVPKNKISAKHKTTARNFLEIDYAETDNKFVDRYQQLFSGNLPLLRASHKSATFAIQWLHYAGVKKVIWVGNDLNAKSPQEKYAYSSNDKDLRKSYNYNVTLDQVHKNLVDWYPHALTKGFEWYSWKCGSVFEKFVPPFNEVGYKHPENSNYYKNSEQSVHNIIPSNFARVVREPKITRKERRELRQFRKNEKKDDPAPAVVIPPIEEPIKKPETPKQRDPIVQKPRFVSVRKGIPSKTAHRIKDALR